MAIAITLLVLDLVLPSRAQLASTDQAMARALGHLWPNLFAFVVGFLVVGIIWVNHRAMFAKVRAVDRQVLFANLILPLVVSAVPSPPACWPSS